MRCGTLTLPVKIYIQITHVLDDVLSVRPHDDLHMINGLLHITIITTVMGMYIYVFARTKTNKELSANNIFQVDDFRQVGDIAYR